ncbi:MAG: hypothetical protein HYZ42_02405, partial [Bacteroidetes bacterium]|nr:hypothetical protein [Bacteroidota bacterium]
VVEGHKHKNIKEVKKEDKILDVGKETIKKASEIVWNFRKNDEVKTEGKRILAKHVNNPQSHLTQKKKTSKNK